MVLMPTYDVLDPCWTRCVIGISRSPIVATPRPPSGQSNTATGLRLLDICNESSQVRRRLPKSEDGTDSGTC